MPATLRGSSPDSATATGWTEAHRVKPGTLVHSHRRHLVVAVRDASGAVVAAVSVSGPIDRMGRRPGARWAADLLAAADALQTRL